MQVPAPRYEARRVESSLEQGEGEEAALDAFVDRALSWHGAEGDAPRAAVLERTDRLTSLEWKQEVRHLRFEADADYAAGDVALLLAPNADGNTTSPFVASFALFVRV